MKKNVESKKAGKITLPKKEVVAIDKRAVPNENHLVAPVKKSVTMRQFFGTEQVQSIAFRISDWYAKGMTDYDVQEQIKLTFGFEWSLRKVQSMKGLLRKYWRSNTVENMDNQIAEEVNACNVQLRELWKSYEISKYGTKKETTRKTSSNGKADENVFDQEETITVRDTTAGDPKIMAQIIEVSKEKRKLLGLYAPEKKPMGSGTNIGQNIQIAVVGSDGKATGSILGSLFNDNSDKSNEQVIEQNIREVEDAVIEEVKVADAEIAAYKQPVEEEFDLDAMYEELMSN